MFTSLTDPNLIICAYLKMSINKTNSTKVKISFKKHFSEYKLVA